MYLNKQFEADNFSQLFRDANYAVYQYGIETKPRDLKIKELINVSLTLTNPRNRLLASKIRKHSNAYAVGEFLWYMRGSEDLDELAYYSDRLRDYSDDNKTLNSAYGARIFGTHKDFPNQWENVKNKLLADSDTRQAVININYSEDQNRVTKDVTCTLGLQYFIRSNKLFALTVMRSNDSFFGFIYDAFCFTMLQEIMLFELKQYEQFKDLELGYYIHNAHSFHLYENYFEKVLVVVQETDVSTAMEPIEEDFLQVLQEGEKYIREEPIETYESVKERFLFGNKKLLFDNMMPQPWSWMLEQLFNKKNEKWRQWKNGKKA
jgi:thymidylate synthase